MRYNRISLNFVHNFEDNSKNNVFAPWVLSRSPYSLNNDPIVNTEAFRTKLKASLFESTSALDNIMVTNYVKSWSGDFASSPNLVFASDPIIFEYFCDCKKVSWMSETGEPEL